MIRPPYRPTLLLSLLAVAVMVVAAGCQGAQSPTAPATDSSLTQASAPAKTDGGAYTFPVEGTTPGECLELVDYEGYGHLTWQVNSSPGGDFFRLHFNFQNVTGVGEESEDPYVLQLNANLRCSQSEITSQEGFTLTLNGKLIDKITHESASLHVTVHFSTNAAGEPTAEVLNVRVVCSDGV